MPKRVLPPRCLSSFVLAVVRRIAGAHGDDADVVFEWNGILQASLALPRRLGVRLQGCRVSLLRDAARRHVRCRELD